MANLYFISVIIFIPGSWIIQRSYAGFVVPSKWLFKNRMIIDGFIAGILLAFFVICFNFPGVENVNAFHLYKILFFSVIAMMLLYFVTGIMINKGLRKIMIDDKMEGEEELIIDSVVLVKGSVKKAGKLALTNKRICFMSKLKDPITIDFYFSQAVPEIEITKEWGIPFGIKIKDNEKEMKINVRFPKYWKRETENILNKNRFK